MKHEWRKAEKDIYMTKMKPQLTTLQAQQFLTIKGQGNPNSVSFQEKIGALYAMSYALKMLPRKGYEVADYFEYTVYPLEGFWTLPESFRGESIDKDLLIYEIMIKQPPFITEELVAEAKRLSAKKVDATLLEAVTLKTIEEGQVVQVLHKGSFDDEPESFSKIAQFCEAHGLERVSKGHKEIYLSDFRKVTPDKLKTILRVEVKEGKHE